MSLMPRKVRAQQGTTAAPVKTPAEDWRLAEGGLWYPGAPGQSSPFRERDGVVAGATPSGASRPLDVVATAASTFTIYPGRFVLGGTTALSGTYEGTVDAATVRSIPGASLPGAGNYKAGLVIAHVYDQTYGDTQDGYDLEIVLGAAASTVNGAAYPAQPSNSLLLKQFTVDSSGTITLGGFLPPFTVPRGGIVPVQSTETTQGAYIGQYRDHPTLGQQRWDGTAWRQVDALVLSAISNRPVASAALLGARIRSMEDPSRTYTCLSYANGAGTTAYAWWQDGILPAAFGQQTTASLVNAYVRAYEGTIVGATNASGDLVITLPSSFVTAPLMVLATPGDTAGGLISTQPVGFSFTGTQITVHCTAANGAAVASQTVRVNYRVIGFSS